MSEQDLRYKTLARAVFLCIGLQTLLGTISLFLGIRGNPFAIPVTVAIWVAVIAIGVSTYRRTMRTQGFTLLPSLVVVASLVAFFLLTS